MKRKIKYKKLISLIFVLILILAFSVQSYAIWNPFDTQRNRAFVAAALTALNIMFETQQMSALSIVDYIADPMEVNYTYVDMWEDRPQIQIWDDYVTIDGVEYTDIWISNEAAEKFRINGRDFITAYNIASQDSGTFKSGVGTIDGVPLFSSDGGRTAISQKYIMPWNGSYKIGNTSVNVGPNTGVMQWSGQFSNGTTFARAYGGNLGNQNAGGYYYYFRPYNQSQLYLGSYKASTGELQNSSTFDAPSSVVNMTPFDFDYVSQTIPADEPLPQDTGMMIRVPSKDPLGNPYFDDFLTDNPEFKDQPVTIDVNLDPDVMNKLGDLINIVAPIIPNINNNFGDVQFIENHVAPQPVPDVPIVDATVPQVVQPIINEIQNQGDIISQSIPPIIESIPKIDEICNNIDTAPYHDLDTGLDHLPSVFLPFITDLRSALGIWHYVTEWIGQISTTFAFVTGCLVGTSIMTPIYAAIAGFMCIKVYRRMTG